MLGLMKSVAASADTAAPEASRLGAGDWLGPGLITGASDDDPSGIGTYAQAGAQFGTGLLWVMLFTFPLMAFVQIISARIGRVTGRGLAANLAKVVPRPLLVLLMLLLFVANTVNIGADLAAMGEAASLLVPVDQTWAAAAFGIVSLLLQVFIPYSRYVRVLRWLTVSLLAYVGVVFAVHIPWGQVLHDTVIPRMQATKTFWAMLVGVLGTTVSPYLFFWQSSQEVEEQRANAAEHPILVAPEQAPAQLHRVQVDTLAGMGVSNLVGFFIMLTTALTLHVHGGVTIATAGQAAEALRPAAGQAAFALFTLGIVGTGLLAVPVLAGSAGYAAAECFAWRRGLERKPASAPRFYAVIAAAGVLGVLLTTFHFNPMRALVWAAVINGVVAVPVLVAMMRVAGKESIMGEFRVSGALLWGGWLTTAAMAAAALLLFVH
jgi:NRAMP (natural resistance-associated macrophage protein)-like metal ion transporter